MTFLYHGSAIRAERLCKSFGNTDVIKSLDLDLPAGCVMGLLGLNGSGKSTLIKCLLGLLRPTQGTVQVFGENVWDLSSEAKQHLGYVPQDVVIYPGMRVRDVLAYTSVFYRNWDHSLCEALCDRWRVPLSQPTNAMSIGQRQVVGLILAVSHRPRLLVLDEPVASLDPVARREFVRFLLEHLDNNESSVLYSTHITSDLERVASHVAILRNGRLGYVGTIDELKDNFKRLYIRSDQGLSASFNVANAVRNYREGNAAVVTVENFCPQLKESIESQWDAKVEVRDLNLEEIVVELHHE